MIDPVSTSGSDSKSSDNPFPADWNYETTVAQVEKIIEQIEAGKLDLAEVFEQFTLAADYLHQCEAFLTERQEQMDLLIETLTDESDF